MNYSRFINRVSGRRKPSPIRVLTALLTRSPPSMISLAAGSPNPALFPYEELTVKVKDGRKIVLDSSKIKQALQYGPSEGNSELISWVQELSHDLHDPPTLGKDKDSGGLQFCVTAGCQDAICKSFEMMVEPGDNVVLDVPTYPGTLAILRPLGANILAVNTDNDGLIPEHLREVLSRWKPSDAKDPKSDIPRVLYTIPNGCNPTGSTLTTERRKQIYQIAREYDMMIMEDDPYYFLQFSKEKAPSFLSLDEDGRVLRFDSFSKVMSSGLRLGVVSGPGPLVNRIVLHQQVSIVHTSMLSQVMVGLLLKEWGKAGFLEHVESVVDFYRKQKEVMISLANKHLSGLAEWGEPVAGMFLWMKLNGIKDTKKLIEERALEKEVLLVPGCAFMPDPEAPCPYVRASFSLATPQQIDMGLERLASLIKEEQRRQS